MRGNLLHILCWTLLSVCFAACSDSHEEVMSEDEGKRMVQLSLNLSTRAAGNEASSNLPQSIKIWVYGGEGEGSKPLLYKEYGQVNWNKVADNVGQGEREYYTYIPERVEVYQSYQNLRVYTVLNSESVVFSTANGNKDLNGTLENNGNLTETQLKEAVFSSITDAAQQNVLDNTVLMYGAATIANINLDEEGNLELDRYFEVTIDAERCVAKLELYFTQRSEFVEFEVKKITLSNGPVNSLGYLLPQAALPEVEAKAAVTLFDGTLDVNSVLPGSVANGYFSQEYEKDNTTFTTAQISVPYLMECKGQPWTTGLPDEVYPTDDHLDAYRLAVTYTYKNIYDVIEEKTRILALSDIKRNTRYCIFMRKGDQKVEVNTATVPWKNGTGDIYIDITPGLPVYDPTEGL